MVYGRLEKVEGVAVLPQRPERTALHHADPRPTARGGSDQDGAPTERHRERHTGEDDGVGVRASPRSRGEKYQGCGGRNHAPREHGSEPREAALSSENCQERAYGERGEPGERRGVEHQIRYSPKAQNDTQEHASGRSRRGEPAKLTA